MLTPPYWWKGVYLLNHLKLDGAPLPVTARASEKSLLRDAPDELLRRPGYLLWHMTSIWRDIFTYTIHH